MGRSPFTPGPQSTMTVTHCCTFSHKQECTFPVVLSQDLAGLPLPDPPPASRGEWFQIPDHAARGVSSGALQSSPFDKISGCNRVAYQKEEAGSLSALNFPPGICKHQWHRAYSKPSTVYLSGGTWKDEPVIGNQCKFCLMSPFDFLQAFWWMCAESGCSLTLRGPVYTFFTYKSWCCHPWAAVSFQLLLCRQYWCWTVTLIPTVSLQEWFHNYLSCLSYFLVLLYRLSLI